MADIRHAILINAPPEKIRTLCSSAKGFTFWWAADSVELGKDGSVELGFFSKSTVYRLRPRKTTESEIIWRCESGKEWEGTDISFRPEPSNGATLLRFAHSNWKKEADYFVLCSTTWGDLMHRLKAAAEGKTPGPLFTITGLPGLRGRAVLRQ